VNELRDAILGPAGALVLALVILYVVGRILLTLWKEHLAADQRDRDQRAEARADADAYRELLREAHSIHRDQVNAWNKRNEQDAARQRRSDRQ